MTTWRILSGDMLDRLKEIPDDSVDACVTDPPYGLSFMGRAWDYDVPSVEHWQSVYRVLKPCAHLLAFFGSRTYHRGVVSVEDAGFDIRDQLQWLYGSGFPKSLDVGKAIDAAAGAKRELTRPGIVRRDGYGDDWDTGSSESRPRYDSPATDAAKQWDGWGTALKPAHEPIVLARKPFKTSVAQNVLAFGTGALNIDGCRLPVIDDDCARNASGDRGHEDNRERQSEFAMTAGKAHDIGRWPANVLLDEDAAALLDAQTGELVSGANPTRRQSDKFGDTYGAFKGQTECTPARGLDVGGASRFYYCAKPSREERDCGGIRNTHPTVKPVDLMQWLVRLVTPEGATVLDPFTGSGTTGMACLEERRHFIGCEKEPPYVDMARARIMTVAPMFSTEITS